MIRRLVGGLFAITMLMVCAIVTASAQNTTGLTLTTCGSPVVAFKAGNPGPFTVDVNGNLCITGTISATASQPVGITPTDRTIVSTSGASQQMMAANAARHSLTIVNTGNANCGVNPTGGTAVIGGAGTITISPLGAYTPRIPTLSAVTIICTAGQPIYGNEN